MSKNIITDPDNCQLVDLSDLEIVISEFSGPNGNCIGVSALPGGGVAICDTTKPEEAPQIHSKASKEAFVKGLQSDARLQAAFGLA